MDKAKQKKLILNENIWKVTFQLSWPAILAMVLYGFNTVFDAIFVGRFVGETALAGVSLAYPLTQISLGIGSLVGVGAGSALSISIGENDQQTQKKILGCANYLNIVLTVVFMILGLLFTESLIRMMGGSGEELVVGVSYFRMTVYGTFFWIAGLAGNMIIRAEGKMKTAAVMMGMGLIVNIIANYILIVILKMGVEGAAIGTNIGMVVYTLTSFVYFSGKSTSFEAKPFSISRDKILVKKIMSMGMPSMIMSMMNVLQGVIVLNALSTFGSTADVAFYGVAYRIFTFMLTPIFGLMRALQPVVGINFGAKQHGRVIKSFKVFAVAATLIMLPFWVVMMFFPSAPLHAMLPGKTFTARDLLNFRIFMAMLPVLPVLFMGMTFFPAINKGKVASLIGIARQLVFYVPVMLIFPRLFGVNAVYTGSFIIDVVVVLWTISLVRKEFKVLRKISSHDNEYLGGKYQSVS